MKCVICRGEDVELRDADEEIAVGSDIVKVPIRVLVCQTCGERYYDPKTMRFLEDAERKLKRKQAVLREVGKVLVYG